MPSAPDEPPSPGSPRSFWAPPGGVIPFLLRESGLLSVRRAGLDAVLVILCRTSRMFAYGASSMVLALFLAALDESDERIGLFMTLTLAGDVALSLFLTLVADRVGRRRVVLVGSLLMCCSGAALATLENYWLLLAAAVLGVLSATGIDAGPFRAIEESVLSELTTPETRSDVLVWYVTSASLGSAAGFELAGRLVEGLKSREGWTLLGAYHAVFWLYAIMGGVAGVASLLMSQRCELKGRTIAGDGDPSSGIDDDLEDCEEEEEDSSRHVTNGSQKTTTGSSNGGGLFSGVKIGSDTLRVMLALWALLMMDSFADGMANMSFTTYFLDEAFHPAKSTVGDLLSTCYVLATIATFLAGPLARHIGLVSTMVFTHIPSSTAVLLFPFATSMPMAAVLLLLRIGPNNMDQAPRAALIAAVVRAEERTAVMGVTGTLRTLAATLGPGVTGLLAGKGHFWIAFVVAGALRLTYDFGLWIMFASIRLYRHEKPEGESGHGTAGQRQGYEPVQGEDIDIDDDNVEEGVSGRRG